MQTFLLFAVLTPVLLSAPDYHSPQKLESVCNDVQLMVESQATALQRVSDCLDHGTASESVDCAADVLNQVED
jgi:hypothetical protein